MNQSVWPDAIHNLFLRWTSHSDLSSLVHTVRLSNLHTLTLAAVGELSSSLLEQISACSDVVTFPSLTRLVLFAGMAYPTLHSTVDFYSILGPFLGSLNMREVYIQFPSFEMDFRTTHLDFMLNSWSLLTLLHVSFVTPPIPSTPFQSCPDLRHVVENTHVRCPHLTTLHIPAIAVYFHPNIPFVLQPSSLHPCFRFSSDTLWLEHDPFDVAFQLANTFPRYMPIRSHFIVGTYWSVVMPLVRLLGWQMEGRIMLDDLEVHDWRMQLEE